MILAYLGDTVKTYQANYLQLLDQVALVCPGCQGSCHRHGWRERHVYGGFWRVVLRVLRVKCTKCGRVHEVLPDFLRPHGRYGQFVREPAVNAVMSGEAAEQVARRLNLVPDTVRRWVRELNERHERATAALRSLLARIAPGETVSLCESESSLERICAGIIQAVARLPASSSLLSLVNILLAHSSCHLWL